MKKKKKKKIPTRRTTKQWLKSLIGGHMPEENVQDLVMWCREDPEELSLYINDAIKCYYGSNWWERLTGENHER